MRYFLKECTLSFDTLVWLFPIAIMLRDFEELIIFEPWLKQKAGEILRHLPMKRSGLPPSSLASGAFFIS